MKHVDNITIVTNTEEINLPKTNVASLELVKCGQCESCFPTLTDLKTHLELKHTNNNQPEVIPVINLKPNGTTVLG